MKEEELGGDRRGGERIPQSGSGQNGAAARIYEAQSTGVCGRSLKSVTNEKTNHQNTGVCRSSLKSVTNEKKQITKIEVSAAEV